LVALKVERMAEMMAGTKADRKVGNLVVYWAMLWVVHLVEHWAAYWVGH
jgi:hypothetical protein